LAEGDAGAGAVVAGTTTCDGLADGGGVVPWHETVIRARIATHALDLITDQSYHRRRR
jgi:hypothetical protein